ncbi:unnamed protein product [Urochloa humidicola]
MAKGDPHTRPDVETVFVPSSFDLERDARDWESCALVPWAMHLPRGDGARAIEELLVEQLHLRRGDVTVMVHQPEPYLIRFERSDHCAVARERGRFTGRGIDICLRPWRSLTHALGMRVFFRVRLCLDGIPSHAWTPEIVERIIGSRCALQSITTDLVQPRDSRHIDLWAWTADPSDIPKRIWLIFTHRPTDRSSAILISEAPPEPWHQGARFQVFIHMPVVEDYSAAANNLQDVIDNLGSFTPIRRTYTWRYGLVDGAPLEARSSFPARLPLPPREKEDARRDDSSRRERRADNRGRGDRRAGGRGRDSRGRGAQEGRMEMGERAERDQARGSRRRTGRSSCKEQAFTWPANGEDEDDDDYDHPGRGNDAASGFSFFSLNDEEPVRRERTRSPRRRDGAFWRRRALDDDHPDQHDGSPRRRDDDDHPPELRTHRAVYCPRLPDDEELNNMTAWELQKKFATHARALRASMDWIMGTEVRSTSAAANPCLQGGARITSARDYIDKARRFAAHLGLQGEAAWSRLTTRGAAEVTVKQAFTTIKSSLGSPSVPEVEAALDALLLASAAEEPGPDEHAGADRNRSDGRVESEEAGLNGPNGPGGPELGSPNGGFISQATGISDGPSQEPGRGLHTGHEAVPAHHDEVGDDDPPSFGIDELFRSPEAVAAAPPLPHCTRQRRTFDMSTVRRSARLASKPPLPMAVRAQRNLIRKLGLAEEELAPMEAVLKEFIAMLVGPLPEHIIAAMTTIFELDDEGADLLNEALLEHAGQGIHDLQDASGPTAA